MTYRAPVADIAFTLNHIAGLSNIGKTAALAGATPFGRLFGLTAGGVFLAKGALAATRAGDGVNRAAHALEARHFAEGLMGETDGLNHAVAHGYETVMEASGVLGAR